jgi:hypothetical protein
MSKGTPKRLILGLDSGCVRCSDLARHIEEKADGLEVRGLSDPYMRRLREQAMGENALWSPTLVEIEGEDVKVHTGKAMAVRLSFVLGPVATWRVMQELGEAAKGREAREPVVSETVGISRSQFLKKGATGAVGAAALASGLFVMDSQALASTGSQTSRTAELGKQAERAVALMEKHMRVTSGNTLLLDEQGLAADIDAGRAKDVEPRVFTALKRELAETNETLKYSRGFGRSSAKVDARDLFPTDNEFDGNASGSVTMLSRCAGRSGVDYFWWGKRLYLDTCETRSLVGRLSAGAGAAAIIAVLPGGQPAAVAATIIGLGAGAVSRANRGRGVKINYLARIVGARVRSQ